MIRHFFQPLSSYRPLQGACSRNYIFKIINGVGMRAEPSQKKPSPPAIQMRDHMPPAIFHLSFQALCSFRNLASPACTGTLGFGFNAADLHADEIACHRSKARIGLGKVVAVIVERNQHLVNDLFRHIRTHVVAEQDRHAQDRLYADVLAEGLGGIDLNGSEVRR